MPSAVAAAVVFRKDRDPGSAVCLAAMTNAVDSQDANVVGDFVDDSVVAYANAPVVLGSREFSAAGRPRVPRESFKSGDDTRSKLSSKPLQILFGRAFDDDLVHRLPFRQISEHVL